MHIHSRLYTNIHLICPCVPMHYSKSATAALGLCNGTLVDHILYKFPKLYCGVYFFFTCVYVCVYVWMYAVCMDLYACVHARVCVLLYAVIYITAYNNTHTQTHTHAYKSIHTYTLHIHIPIK